MQFTQIKEISSFLTPSIENSSQIAINLQLIKGLREKLLNEIQSNDSDSQYSHVMQNLNELVVNQSYIHNFEDNEDFVKDEKINLNNLVKQQSQKDKQNQSSSSTFDNQNYKKYDKTKSIIFSSSLSNVRSHSSTIQKLGNKLKIFYFDEPIFKYVCYDQKTTISQVVQNALKIFNQQNKFNQNLRASKPPQMYQMRLTQNQTSFKSDKTVEPIQFDRLVSDNLFQTLVLVEKDIKNEELNFRKSMKLQNLANLSSSKRSRASFQQKNTLLVNKNIKITLVNQNFFQMAEVELNQNQTIQKLFTLIEENNLHQLRNFYISQQAHSQFSLPRDFEVKNLQTCTLFVKIKRFADEASDQKELAVRSIRLNSMYPRQINYMPPIGINEASKYEEYEVVKINKLGIAQERVLGIDQMKLYNYQRSIRKQKKQITFFSKFIGLNNITGTKKPFRLIKDIKQVKSFNGGIIICFPQKQITYIIKDQIIKERILRKLNFLMTLSTTSDKIIKSQTQTNN